MLYQKKDFEFYQKRNSNNEIVHSDVLNDLLKGTFDVTWHKNLPDNNPERIFSIIDPELHAGAVDDKTITYKYNEDFFRCDSFKKNHDGKHILFSGCSETEGVGGNIEDSWAHILYTKISKEEKCSGFFNLAKSGWGWSRIIINALIYFKKYGYPDTYFILLPNHQRKFYYKDNMKELDNTPDWTYWQTYPIYYSYKSKATIQKISDPKEYFEDFMFFLINWKTFAELCNSNNVKLIFSTWDNLDSENLKPGPFPEFIELNLEESDKYFKQYYQNNPVKKDDHKKRDGHSGRIFHYFWSEKFYEKYKELGG